MTTARTAVVTGGRQGIGRAVADLLHDLGWQVAVLDLGHDASSPEFQWHDVDISDGEAVNEAFDRVGTIHALVNCAGIREIVPALELSHAEWGRVLDVNLNGTFYCAQAAARRMPHGGAIVNVASVTALRGFAHRAAYSASKAGVLGLTRSLSQDLAPMGVRVNAVCPGLIETPLTSSYVDTTEARLGLDLTVPMARAGTAAEVARAVQFLLSDDAGYITGVALPVDGGFAATGTFDPVRDMSSRVRPPA